MAIGARLLGAAAVAVAGGVVAMSALGADEEVAGPVGPIVAPEVAALGEGTRTLAGARLVVRAADPDAPRVEGPLYELSSRGARRVGRLACKRVHVNRDGRGVCLTLRPDGRRYEGIAFNEGYSPGARFKVPGVPNRVRVSPDGRFAGVTSFDWGSSQGYFANTASFSVDTRIVDLATGRTALRLDDNLEMVRRGRRFEPVDVEFWGVTFDRRGGFLATMGDVFDHYLVAGRVGSRRLDVLVKGIECPSLSPDGRRIAYKRRVPYTQRWRLRVRDLRSGRDVALAETRSIDDQPEWLDRDRIAYSDGRSVYGVPADGQGEPVRLAAGAASPAALVSR